MDDRLQLRLLSMLGLISACMALCSQSHAETRARVAITTDYLQRGLQQNSHGLAYQGLLEHGFDNGLFLGAWVSSVDFGSFDDRAIELDYFAGYSYEFAPALAVDVTLIHYTYPGETKPRDYDWTEVMVSAYLGDRWLFSAGVADNWLSLDNTTAFVEGSYRYPLPARLTLDLTLGYQSLQAPLRDYSYGEVGVSRRVGALEMRVGYSSTGNDAPDWYDGWADDRWLASISYEI